MPANVRNIIAWILQIILGLLFIKSGFDKLSALDKTTQMFGGMGLPGWFAAFIGGAELLGGTGLLIPRTVRLAALGLITIMVGAIVMHATRIPGGIRGGIPAIMILVGLIIVYLLRRNTPAATGSVAG